MSVDDNAATPLHFACLSKQGSLKTVDLLLKDKRTDPARLDSQNGNVLMNAVCTGNIDTLKRLLSIEKLTSMVTARDKAGNSSLHYSAFHGFPGSTELLVGSGLNLHKIDLRDGSGRTPLHFAAARGHVADATIFLKHDPDMVLMKPD